MIVYYTFSLGMAGRLEFETPGRKTVSVPSNAEFVKVFADHAGEIFAVAEVDESDGQNTDRRDVSFMLVQSFVEKKPSGMILVEVVPVTLNRVSAGNIEQYTVPTMVFADWDLSLAA